MLSPDTPGHRYEPSHRPDPVVGYDVRSHTGILLRPDPGPAGPGREPVSTAVPQTCHTPGASTVSGGNSRVQHPAPPAHISVLLTPVQGHRPSKLVVSLLALGGSWLWPSCQGRAARGCFASQVTRQRLGQHDVRP